MVGSVMTLSEHDEREWRDLVRRLEELEFGPEPERAGPRRIGWAGSQLRSWRMQFLVYPIATVAAMAAVYWLVVAGRPFLFVLFPVGAALTCLGAALCLWRLRPPRDGTDLGRRPSRKW